MIYVKYLGSMKNITTVQFWHIPVPAVTPCTSGTPGIVPKRQPLPEWNRKYPGYFCCIHVHYWVNFFSLSNLKENDQII